MTEEQFSQLSDLEKEFRLEEKGYGSLAPHLLGSQPNVIKAADEDEGAYVGFDIHPENIEALYFDGIGVPRWESVKADSVEEQEALYMKQFNELMTSYPMIGRANDTYERVEYKSGEVPALIEECERVMAATSDAKVKRAVQKFLLASRKATDQGLGLEFLPRQ